MSNLWKGQINTNNEYQKLETISGLSFENDKTYTIQIVGSCTLCESESLPTEGGFLIDNKSPIQYTAGTGDLYVKNDSYYCEINIAE